MLLCHNNTMSNAEFCVHSKHIGAGNELSECNAVDELFLFVCAVTMAETDRHVRVAPRTLRWNLQESAKSVQITTLKKLSGGGFSFAVRLESQFFSPGFCCPGNICVHCPFCRHSSCLDYIFCLDLALTRTNAHSRTQVPSVQGHCAGILRGVVWLAHQNVQESQSVSRKGGEIGQHG